MGEGSFRNIAYSINALVERKRSIFVQIAPIRIDFVDQSYFFSLSPFFNFLFTVALRDFIKKCLVNQTICFVFFENNFRKNHFYVCDANHYL